jgi:hypothetical protein
VMEAHPKKKARPSDPGHKVPHALQKPLPASVVDKWVDDVGDYEWGDHGSHVWGDLPTEIRGHGSHLWTDDPAEVRGRGSHSWTEYPAAVRGPADRVSGGYDRGSGSCPKYRQSMARDAWKSSEWDIMAWLDALTEIGGDKLSQQVLILLTQAK